MTPLKNKKSFRSLIFFALIAVAGLLLALCLPTSDADPAGPTASDILQSPEPDLPPSPQDSYTGPDVPELEPVDDEFFSDAAFMGNSLVDGFKLFSGLAVCDYYTATSMTVLGATSNSCITLDDGTSCTMVDGLTQKPYGKIYILLGINEIGGDVDTFGQMYADMLDTIIAAQPECDIYVMGLTPVSYEKSSSSDTFNMERIALYNEKLRSIAAEKRCYYLDLISALSGEDGYLPASETTDGVHFTAGTYAKWLDYLRTHYIEPET